ncbi:MAG: tRNA pseudouridine55 synthase [Chloroflexota bacterium]|jgi:tRNA pseudouridine55 synthase|nr:tRNA pseudouridine55 synthase [Chloroflexota bacterium]
MSKRPAAGPELDGVLVVAKPAGPTSHDIVALVRRLTGVRRVGHGGTLDPFAAGVLPIFLGHATRVVEYHLSDTKEYRADVIFGARSTTDDLDGELAPSDVPAPTREQLEAALEGFRGEIEQVPPDYSAVRVAGRHAYELARHGEKPELRSRRVTILGLDLLAWNDSDPSRPIATLHVRCSAGTYIRAIARDLGEALGSGAYLAALTRTASGPFTLERAHPLEKVREALANGRAAAMLLPPDVGLDAYPRVSLGGEDLGALARGQVIRHHASHGLTAGPQGLLRVVDGSGRLAAIARLEGGRLYPEKVFVSVAGAAAP